MSLALKQRYTLQFSLSEQLVNEISVSTKRYDNDMILVEVPSGGVNSLPESANSICKQVQEILGNEGRLIYLDISTNDMNLILFRMIFDEIYEYIHLQSADFSLHHHCHHSLLEPDINTFMYLTKNLNRVWFDLEYKKRSIVSYHAVNFLQRFSEFKEGTIVNATLKGSLDSYLTVRYHNNFQNLHFMNQDIRFYKSLKFYKFLAVIEISLPNKWQSLKTWKRTLLHDFGLVKIVLTANNQLYLEKHIHILNIVLKLNEQGNVSITKLCFISPRLKLILSNYYRYSRKRYPLNTQYLSTTRRQPVDKSFFDYIQCILK